MERKRRRKEEALEREEQKLAAVKETRRQFDGGNATPFPTAIKPSDIDAERARLKYVLQTVSQEDIVERIKSALMVSDPFLTLLSNIFDKELFPGESPSLKCTRCDLDYDPAYNTTDSCKLPHPRESIDAVSSDQYGTTFQCDECDTTWDVDRDCTLDDDMTDCGYCFIGPHTTKKNPLKAIKGLNG